MIEESDDEGSSVDNRSDGGDEDTVGERVAEERTSTVDSVKRDPADGHGGPGLVTVVCAGCDWYFRRL
jgi:hypothetical protein